MMFLGMIEIAVILMLIVVGGGLLVMSLLSQGRIDLAKVFFVFVGVPIGLIALIGSYWALKSTSGVRETQAIQVRDHQMVSIVHDVENQSEDVVRPEAQAQSESAAFEFPRQIATESQRNGLGFGITAISLVIVLGLIGGIFWMSRHRPALALTFVALLMLLGLTLGVVGTKPSSVTSMVTGIEEEAASGAKMIELGDPAELQPGKVGEAETPGQGTPLDIREVEYKAGAPDRSTSMEQMPGWVTSAQGEDVINLETGEFVLFSERFSTVAEAEAQLWAKVSQVIRDDIHHHLPETRHYDFSQQAIKELEIRVRTCEIVWPLHVGEFEEEVHQVVWKLRVNENDRSRLYAMWQSEERLSRLAILAAGLGILTIIFGAGAVMSRRRADGESMKRETLHA